MSQEGRPGAFPRHRQDERPAWNPSCDATCRKILCIRCLSPSMEISRCERCIGRLVEATRVSLTLDMERFSRKASCSRQALQWRRSAVKHPRRLDSPGFACKKNALSNDFEDGEQPGWWEALMPEWPTRRLRSTWASRWIPWVFSCIGRGTACASYWRNFRNLAHQQARRTRGTQEPPPARQARERSPHDHGCEPQTWLCRRG